MKYFMLVPDGCGDWPNPSLGGKTPLEAADLTHINQLAKISQVGLVGTIPEGLKAGSEANVTLLGYGPDAYRIGRAPLEAVAMGIAMAASDVAFRVNLITVDGSGRFEDLTFKDHSAGEISTEEAEILMQSLDSALGGRGMRFYAGVGYRGLGISNWFTGDYKLSPPHDLLHQRVGDHLPQEGDGAEALRSLICQSHELLKTHPVNQKRIQNGLRPANSIWIWGYGHKGVLAPFQDKYGIAGSVITAVNLIKGYGLCAGLSVIDVPGADGTLHTNYEGKALGAIRAFQQGRDFVFLHVEAPDECSHNGDLNGKIEALAQIDAKIFRPILNYLQSTGEPYRILVVTDHKTLLETRAHSAEPVPYVLFDSENRQPPDDGKAFSEVSGAKGVFFASGQSLADYFFGSH